MKCQTLVWGFYRTVDSFSSRPSWRYNPSSLPLLLHGRIYTLSRSHTTTTYRPVMSLIYANTFCNLLLIHEVCQVEAPWNQWLVPHVPRRKPSAYRVDDIDWLHKQLVAFKKTDDKYSWLDKVVASSVCFFCVFFCVFFSCRVYFSSTKKSRYVTKRW